MCGFIGFISNINDKQNEIISKKFDIYYNELKKKQSLRPKLHFHVK